MDINEFTILSQKSYSTVKSWLKNELVPGAMLQNGAWVFSKYAMPPYTAVRARKGNATSIRKAILKAALQHKSTCPKLLNIPKHVFDSYVDDLETHGLIRVLVDPLFPEDKFILTTMKADEYFRERGILGKEGLLTTITSKVIEGAVSALIKSALEE